MNGHHGNSNSNGFASHGKSPSSYSDLASANNLVVKTTENWLELFLTTPEKFKFGQWKEEIRDKSVSGYLTKPLWNYLAQQIPPTIAPNVLALFGLGLLIQACVVNVHADRIRQRTPLGDFFKYATDSAATVFLSILTTYCLGGSQDESMEAQWYAVQIAQLVLYVKHLSAFHRQAGLRFSLFSGPGEVIGTAVTLLAIRATLGLEWMVTVYETLLQYISQTTGNVKVTETPGNQLLKIGYYSMYLLAVTKTMLLREPHGWSRFGLSASLLMRLIPAFLYFQLGSDRGCGMTDVICDGLFMAVLTSDITLAKMAGREVHPWVVLMSLAATFSHSVILALCITYYIAVFADLCAYLNMPLLTTCRNVYCDGIYDLCHIGHKLLFQNALQHGNRLFVGVVGDKDAQNYKRPPIMTSKERCAEVEACKAVTKVIPDAPCFGLTREFLDEHQIHVVAYGEEYLERYPDPKDDPYYRVPREMGIARPLPRTKGLSTSDLIRRIQQAQPADEKVSPT
ncbi:cytidyltransferase like protein [Nitzschia inconspicua]|uniref:Cytidyltransferase like protein n=1 Tax=Nitzschia inconspicua TaxID=303405 RepID=A0A9K3KIE2_9STRA|nr:cytidyltransferase like protein [Nitzschia inconspicua]